MHYTNFDTNITEQLGIVVEKWPLKKFTSPAHIHSKNEVEILFRSWKSGTSYFRRLSSAEWDEWKAKRFQTMLDMQMQPEAQEGAEPCSNEEIVENEDDSGAADITMLDPLPSPPSTFQHDITPNTVVEHVNTASALPSLPSTSVQHSTIPNNVGGDTTMPPFHHFTQPGITPPLEASLTINGAPPSQLPTQGSKRAGPSHSTSSSKKKKVVPIAGTGVFKAVTSTSGDGNPITLPKKPRKVRSDAGKKRGPRGSRV